MEKEFFKYLFSLDLISKEYDQEFIFNHITDCITIKNSLIDSLIELTKSGRISDDELTAILNKADLIQKIVMPNGYS